MTDVTYHFYADEIVLKAEDFYHDSAFKEVVRETAEDIESVADRVTVVYSDNEKRATIGYIISAEDLWTLYESAQEALASSPLGGAAWPDRAKVSSGTVRDVPRPTTEGTD